MTPTIYDIPHARSVMMARSWHDMPPRLIEVARYSRATWPDPGAGIEYRSAECWAQTRQGWQRLGEWNRADFGKLVRIVLDTGLVDPESARYARWWLALLSLGLDDDDISIGVAV